MPSITSERAERIAKSHACSHCLEYTFSRISVKPAPPAIKEELQVEWVATRFCGVCKHQTELGIADDGDVVYES